MRLKKFIIFFAIIATLVAILFSWYFSKKNYIDVGVDIANKIKSNNENSSGIWPNGVPISIPAPLFMDKMEQKSGIPSNTNMGFSGKILFKGVSKYQAETYLGKLKNSSFSIKGFVLYSGIKDKSAIDKLHSQGKFDVIKASKGQYTLNFSWDSIDKGYLSIEVLGLTKNESSKLNIIDWPSSWSELLPPPDECELYEFNGIKSSSESLLSVNCSYKYIGRYSKASNGITLEKSDQQKHKKTFDNYILKLCDKNFKIVPAETSSTKTTLKNAKVSVTITPNIDGEAMEIVATKKPES